MTSSKSASYDYLIKLLLIGDSGTRLIELLNGLWSAARKRFVLWYSPETSMKRQPINRRRQVLPAAAVQRRLVHAVVHHDDRHRLQDPDHRAGRQAHQVADCTLNCVVVWCICRGFYFVTMGLFCSFGFILGTFGETLNSLARFRKRSGTRPARSGSAPSQQVRRPCTSLLIENERKTH